VVREWLCEASKFHLSSRELGSGFNPYAESSRLNCLVFKGGFVDDFTQAKTWLNGDKIRIMNADAFTYLDFRREVSFEMLPVEARLSFESVSLGSVQELLLLFEREFFNVDGRCPQVFVSHEALNLPIISASFSSPVCSEVGPLTMIM
jgi:hypothetical protein